MLVLSLLLKLAAIAFIVAFVVKVVLLNMTPVAEPRQGRVFIAVLLALLVIAGTEQVVLHLYVDPLVERDSRGVEEFVSGVKSRAAKDRTLSVPLCESRRAWFLYRYRICLRAIPNRPTGSRSVYSVGIVKPHGLFSLVPWNDPGRAIWDGLWVADLYASLEFSKRR